MTIHHLNCATMCPYGSKLITGQGGLLARGEIIAHVLLIETADALVLVDTGLGTGDVADPKRLGVPFRTLVRPICDGSETVIARMHELGLDPRDVRHVVATHLDVDHAGGLPDFPDAEVHVFRPEMEAALNPTWRERERYVRAQFEHGPRWAAHEVAGDEWFGFEGVRPIPGLDPDVVLIPLVGHSRGHSGVAVRDGDSWLLHCGDAYFNRGEKQTPPSCPPGMRAFEALVGFNGPVRRQNQERLRELAREHGDEVRLFSAHDAVELRELQAAA